MKKLLMLAAVMTMMLSAVGGAFAQDDIDLPETFTSDAGDITLNHPEDWEIISEAGLTYVIKGGEEVLEVDDIPPGSAAFMILPPELLAFFGVEEADTSPSAVVDALMALIADENPELDMADLEETTLNDETETEMILLPFEADAGDGFIAGIGYEAGTVGILAVSAAGEFEEFGPTIRAMLDTLVYQEPTGEARPHLPTIPLRAKNPPTTPSVGNPIPSA